MSKLFIIMLNVALVTVLSGANNNVFPNDKSCIKPAISSYKPAFTNFRRGMIEEGFEDTFPPEGWDTLSTPGGIQGTTLGIPIGWHQTGDPYYHTGIYGAAYGWGYNLDGWLRILSLDFSDVLFIELSFWWESSFKWSVDSNNADLFVEISTDAGMTWDTIWTFGDSADVVNSGVSWPWGNWEWYQSFFNLDTYIGESDVLIGFHVVGDDNADIAIDDVLIDTSTTEVGEESSVEHFGALILNAPTIITKGPVTIELILPEATWVDLLVYDVVGRLSETLVSKRLFAGTHRFYTQINVAPGIYFYSVETRLGKPFTKKFLVIE